MKRLDYYWYSHNAIAWLLLPLSLLFCSIVKIRQILYRSKILSSSKLQCPVIVIGNISVGGTGKTPLLIAVCELLKDKGYSPGVISRGYTTNAGSSVINVVHQVNGRDTAEQVGDEPIVIVQKTRCPVVIGQNRAAAGRYLLENNDCDIVLSDDGLQHYKLQRDLEFAVVDSSRKYGNGFCIPAGPLREPVSRLDSVDIVITHNTGHVSDNDAAFELLFENPINVHNNETRALEAFKNIPCHAVAGIGHPQRFFNQLKNNGIDIIEHAFPDHHAFQKEDFSFGDNAAIIMTEKDAVKCKFMELENAWYVPVTAKLSKSLESRILANVEKLQLN